MLSKKSYLVIALAVVVAVSGCAQAAIITEAFKKLKDLEAGPGYSADYTMNFKIQLNDKLKAAAASDPTAAAGISQLENMPALNIKLSESKKAGKQKSVIDISGLKALGITDSQMPFTKISTYENKDDISVCIEVKTKLYCTKGTKEELAKKIPGFAKQLSSASQFSQQSPDKLLEEFKTLYDKGALKLGPQGKSKIIDRECDQISYTVTDLSKLSPKELLTAMGPFGSQLSETTDISESDLGQLSFIFQKLIKEIKQDFCLDKQHGLPLSYSYSIQLDLSALMKLIAGNLGGAGDQSGQLPEGAGFSIQFDTVATSFKTQPEASELDMPAGAEVIKADEFLDKVPELKAGEATLPVALGPE